MRLLATVAIAIALLVAGAGEGTPLVTSSTGPAGPPFLARTATCVTGDDGHLMSVPPSNPEVSPGPLGLTGSPLRTGRGVSCEPDMVDDAGVPEMLGPPPGSPPPSGPANGDIDAYAAYDPQRICAPAPLPATLALRDLLVTTYPGTASGGISRDCAVGGTSEHKEGRAVDWAVSVYDPDQRRAAEDFLARLLATDAAGNRHALARRMGVMYVIWNGEIWSASRPDEGWRPYYGPSPHTDHVHLSLSWAGALGLTSYWRGWPGLLSRVTPDPSQLGRGVLVPTPRPRPAPPSGPAPGDRGPALAPAQPIPPPVVATQGAPQLTAAPQRPAPPPVTASAQPVRSTTASPNPPAPAASAAGAAASPAPQPTPPSLPPPASATSPPVATTPGAGPAPTCASRVPTSPAGVQPQPPAAGGSPVAPTDVAGAIPGPVQLAVANAPAPPPSAQAGASPPSSAQPCPQPGAGTSGALAVPSASSPAVGTPPATRPGLA